MNQQGPNLNFKPVHQGLGFHPFSDGLPYAPQGPLHRPKKPVAAGATVAGPIRIAPTITKSSVPEALPLQVPSYGLSYLGLRVLAYGIDLAFHLSLSALALWGLLVAMGYEATVVFENGVMEMSLLSILIAGWVLMTAQEVALGSTPGKRIVGLKLQGSAATIFIRSFFFSLSLLFFGLGLVWALFNRQRRCWHDLAADLQPTKPVF